METSLKDALKRFVNIFGRNGTDIGSIKFNDFDNKDETLDGFYNLLSYDKVLTIGGEMFMDISPQKDLYKTQLGWYIVKDKNGSWINDDQKWKKDWIVFAKRYDDAIYFNQSDHSVYGSIDKKQFFKLSNSLAQFISILNDCMILELEKYQLNTSTDDDEPKPEFLEDVNEILNNTLDESTSNHFMSFFFK